MKTKYRCISLATLLLALAFAGCPRPTPAPTTVEDPIAQPEEEEPFGPGHGTHDAPPAPACDAHPGAIWHDLASVELDRPDEATPLPMTLPAGVTVPPANEERDGDCEVVGGIGALAAPGQTLRRCCSRSRRGGARSFPRGCMMPFSCHYELDGERASTPTALAELLGPPSTAGEALGLVALHHVEILDPAVIALDGSTPYGFRGVENPVPTFEVESLDGGGWVVHAAAYSTCGCTHHLVRLTFDVSASGCVERRQEPPRPIAWSVGLCVD